MPGISNHFDTLTAIQTLIELLSLEGMTGRTVIQEVAWYEDGQAELPLISVSPYGAEKLGDELNDRDGVYYGCLVAIIGRKDSSSLEQRLSWRQAMRRQLNNRSIPGLGQNYNLQVEPGNVIEHRAYFDRKAFVSGFVVRAYFQEPRS